MIASQIAIFIAYALFLTIPLSFLLARVAKIMQRNSYENELKMLFNLYWDHSPEDELYAWYKVRHILLQREEKSKRIHYVNRKIAEFNKQQLYGNMSVTKDGKLIDECITEEIDNKRFYGDA